MSVKKEIVDAVKTEMLIQKLADKFMLIFEDTKERQDNIIKSITDRVIGDLIVKELIGEFVIKDTTA